MNSTFNEGDKVYLPLAGTKCFTLKLATNTSFKIQTDVREYVVNRAGKFSSADAQPVIFKATEENRTVLSNLYGVEFEKTTSLLDKLLERYGSIGVLCLHFRGDEKPKDVSEALYAPIVVIKGKHQITQSYFDSRGREFTDGENLHPITIDRWGDITYLTGEEVN